MNAETKELLVKFQMDFSGYDKEEATELVEGSATVSEIDYIPDCPGWTGKVIFVIWGAGVGCHQVLKVVEKDGVKHLEVVNQEF
jgi:hypothetical protein